MERSTREARSCPPTPKRGPTTFELTHDKYKLTESWIALQRCLLGYEQRVKERQEDESVKTEPSDNEEPMEIP